MVQPKSSATSALNVPGKPLKRPAHFLSSGTVVGVRGPVVLARLPHAALGDLCYITLQDDRRLPAQVTAFQGELIYLSPLENAPGIAARAPVRNSGRKLQVHIHNSSAGQVLDALGQPLIGHADTAQPTTTCSQIRDTCPHQVDLMRAPPSPLTRKPIERILVTGVKSIDGLCTLGCGQRVGLFAGAGVGKSTLLGMIARGAAVDVTVIALVGERGREVNEFLQNDLGSSGLNRSIVVVATNDESPVRRYTAALTATAIAEYFRDAGKRVLLLMDSLSRAARALRDIGLACGEMPVRHGYPPSVYTELPRLLERTGTAGVGSITAIYTVLTEDGQTADPLAEEVKSILDGHLVLDGALAAQGIRPAVDVTSSVSRLLERLLPQERQADIRHVTKAFLRLKRDRDIVLFGGTPDPELQRALTAEHKLLGFLCQSPREVSRLKSTQGQVMQLAQLLTTKTP